MSFPVWALAVCSCIGFDGLVVAFLIKTQSGQPREPRPELARDLVDQTVQQRILRSLGRTLVHASPVRWEEPLEYPLTAGWDEDDVLALLTEIEGL